MKLRDIPNHHAVLVIHHNRQDFGISLWEELGSAPSMHKYVNQAVLDIDTARDVIAWANIPYHEDRFAIISFHTATLPAQNALLKILEEPKEGVRFILITTNKEHLLETVISRAMLVRADSEEANLSLAQTFLETKPMLRMKLPGIVKLLSQEDDAGRKDREQVRTFILSVAEALSFEKNIRQKYIKETLEMASYAGDPSIAIKPVIEYLSLLLPKCDTI